TTTLRGGQGQTVSATISVPLTTGPPPRLSRRQRDVDRQPIQLREDHLGEPANGGAQLRKRTLMKKAGVPVVPRLYQLAGDAADPGEQALESAKGKARIDSCFVGLIPLLFPAPPSVARPEACRSQP